MKIDQKRARLNRRVNSESRLKYQRLYHESIHDELDLIKIFKFQISELLSFNHFFKLILFEPAAMFSYFRLTLPKVDISILDMRILKLYATFSLTVMKNYINESSN